MLLSPTNKIFLTIVVLVFSFGTSLQAQEYRKVKAKKGQGIYSLLLENGLGAADCYDKFVELNGRNLGPDHQLIKGKTYLLPAFTVKKTESNDKTGVYPIFGDNYKKVEFKDDLLQGAVFYIVSGHGGPDPGAMGKKEGHTLCEDEYAYDVALRLARNLLEHNATVNIIVIDPNDGIRDDRYLKCDKDEYCGDRQVMPLNQVKRLKQRTKEINSIFDRYRGSYQRMIELHVDSRYSGQNIDIFFYHHPNSKQGRKLCNTLYNSIKVKYDQHQPSRGYFGTVESRNLYMLKNSRPVGAYIELGNINHELDQKRLVIVDNRQAIANWLTLGLIKDFENSKK
jgi:N-acetylmuramoyl-L-alanine amidase